jgi:methyl-accepting chemotaxis protein
MNIKNLKISTQLTAAMGLLTVLLIGVVVFAIAQMQGMRNNTQAITENWLPSVGLVGELKASVANLRSLESQHILNTDEAAMERFEKMANEAIQSTEVTRQAYEKLVNEPDEKTLFAAFETDWKNYLALHKQMIEMSTARDKFPARKMLEGEAKVLFDKINATVRKIFEYNQQGAEAARLNTEASSSTARNSMVVILLVAVSVAIFATLWVTRSVTGPITTVVALANDIAEGDLTRTITIDSDNETGRLLAALQRMQTNLADVVSQVRTGSESVATASSEIAQGNHDLSARTEQQASALEETAASMEIKTLINASVERVEQGSSLVDKAGETMTEVVSSIRRVTDIMGEISAASSEQSAGVSQVGEAVTQMDQATQQNAALVEEMAAAASSLKSQANDLVQVVATFKL